METIIRAETGRVPRGYGTCCGRANTLLGKTYVYSGPMARPHSPATGHCRFYALTLTATFCCVRQMPDNAPGHRRYDFTLRVRSVARSGTGVHNPGWDAHRNPNISVIDPKGTCRFYFGCARPSTRSWSAVPYHLSAWEVRRKSHQTTYPQPWLLRARRVFVTVPAGGGAPEGTPGGSGIPGTGDAPWTEGAGPGLLRNCGPLRRERRRDGRLPRAVHFAWSRLGGGNPKRRSARSTCGRGLQPLLRAARTTGGHTWRRSDGHSATAAPGRDRREDPTTGGDPRRVDKGHPAAPDASPMYPLHRCRGRHGTKAGGTCQAGGRPAGAGSPCGTSDHNVR